MHYSNLVLDSLTFWRNPATGTPSSQENLTSWGTLWHLLLLVKRYLLAESKNVVMICKDITDIKEEEAQLLTHTTTIREMNAIG